MPPKRKFTKEEIISAAFKLVKEQGIEALTARGLGNALNSSARPIFTVFDSMREVRKDVEGAAWELYNQYIEAGLCEKLPFKGSGKAYIRLAREEPNIFRMLFMTGEPQVPDINEVLQHMDSTSLPISGAASTAFKIDREAAQRMHHHLWIYCHGIAVLQATGVCSFTDSEIDRMLTEVGGSLYNNMRK